MKHYLEERWITQARNRGSLVMNACFAHDDWQPVFVRVVPNPDGPGLLMEKSFR